MSTFLRSPLTDVGGTLFTHQSHTDCNDFEMRYINCMEAYGFNKGTKVCADFFADLQECSLKDKRKARVKAMLAERKRQIRTGEATYAEPPHPDIM